MFGCEFVLTHDDDSFNLLTMITPLLLYYCYVQAQYVTIAQYASYRACYF